MTDEVGIGSDEATTLIELESILERVLLVVQVRNDESVVTFLPLDRVKYECSASGYLKLLCFGEMSKFDYQHKSASLKKRKN